MAGPAPGTIRPYNLTDIFNVINDQAVGDTGNAITSGVSDVVGVVGEASETVVITDSAFGSVVTTAPGWDQGMWNAFSWQ